MARISRLFDAMFGHARFRRRDESMHLSALVKRRFDCAYQRGQAWKTIGLASCRMTCLARAHAHSKPRTRVHHLLVAASRTLTRRGTLLGQNVLVLEPIYTDLYPHVYLFEYGLMESILERNMIGDFDKCYQRRKIDVHQLFYCITIIFMV